jgi:hypothetical protein
MIVNGNTGKFLIPHFNARLGLWDIPFATENEGTESHTSENV